MFALLRNRVAFGLSLFALAAIRAFPADPDPLYADLAARSYPVDLPSVSFFNPWGERLEALDSIPEDFGLRVATAARVYSDQKVRFDGYVGSEDDGLHYQAAADGKDGAYYGDENRKTYRLARDKKVDDLRERVWVCPDYPIHALTLAGFPLRQAIVADWLTASDEYTAYGRFASNRPTDHWFFRRILNVQRYFRRQQFYSEDRVTQKQYRDPNYRPPAPFAVGDVVFMGHYGDDDRLGPWVPKHSGICAGVDDRGLPVKIYNMRVSVKMIDEYDGVIDHTRTIGGKHVFFKRFSDRYSLVGHGRVIQPFTPPPAQPAPPELALGQAGKDG